MTRRITFTVLSTAIGLLNAPTVLAQSAAAPQFEVSSVKPSPPSTIARAPMKVDPARLVYNNMSPKILIQIAYKVPEWGISGGPQWLDSDRYDLVATLPPNSSADQIPMMLQALLAERFHLIVQHVTRQLPVYTLTVAKNGPKLKAGDPGEQWTEGAMKGGIFKGNIELHQMTLGGLAEVLASKMGRPVLDTTHLTGVFDINLKWNPDDTPGGASDSDGASLYTAVSEQLGLALKPTRAPVDVLVVVHMEKPSEN